MSPLPETNEDGEASQVAVVYFHGIGKQRRYEETSRLIDAIDVFSRSLKTSPGILWDIRPKSEKSNVDANETVTYIRSRYGPPGMSAEEATEICFYEVYWAPLMANRSSARRVLTWLFGKILRPLQIRLGTWRERQRLKRSALVRLFDDRTKWPEGVRQEDFDELSGRYDKFEKPNVVSEYPRGTFSQFREFLSKGVEDKQRSRRCLLLSAAWRRTYALSEVKNAFLIGTLGLTLAMLGASVIGAGLLILRLASGLGVGDYLTEIGATSLAEMTTPSVTNAIALTVAVVGLLGLTRFLSEYLGDVESWTTYEETDEKHRHRSNVIDRGCGLLKHVLAAEHFGRVVVVGHSLGTAIAQDCLLQLRRFNQATNAGDPITGPVPLEKIEHFITLGSPIDKIHYFFESSRSQYHRYRRVVEELRGDIGEAPFSKKSKPHIHWINYWDEADLVSGSLHSPSSVDHFKEGAQRVDNVHTSNLYFPSPGEAHSAYFENSRVVGDIFDIVCQAKHRFADAPRHRLGGPDCKKAFVVPGEKSRATRIVQSLAVSAPYLVLGTAILYLERSPSWMYLTLGSAFLSIALLWILGSIVGKFMGSRHPI